MTANRPHFPPTGYAVRVDGQGWRAWHDGGAWRGPWRFYYRDALGDAWRHSEGIERRHARGSTPSGLYAAWASRDELL
jgi:hypothetical protein